MLSRRTILRILFAFLFLLPVRAAGQGNVAGWYAGVLGGLPFGVSTFSGFGSAGVQGGGTGGVFGGYRFSPLLSLEAATSWGVSRLSPRDCCTHYWLGSDGVRYLAAVAGMEGTPYSALQSRTRLQRYALQLNVNVLALFPALKQSRWSLAVQPQIGTLRSKADLRLREGGQVILTQPARWHAAVGGGLVAGYRPAPRVGVQLYSSVVHLAGGRLDAAPHYWHHTNLIWETGLRLSWNFGRKRRTAAAPVYGGNAVPAPIDTMKPQPEVKPMPVDTIAPHPAETPTPPEKAGQADTGQTMAAPPLPLIYFPFDRAYIPASQMGKMQELLDTLRHRPEATAVLTGWCDIRGSKAVNDRLSVRRAQSVKAWLVKRGIPARRLRIRGRGRDFKQRIYPKARRVEMTFTEAAPQRKEAGR